MLPKSSKPTLLAALVAGALGIASSATTAFLVAESNTGKAELYNATGTHLVTFASGLSTPIGVEEGGGSVFISSYGNDMINKYTPGGTSQGGAIPVPQDTGRRDWPHCLPASPPARISSSMNRTAMPGSTAAGEFLSEPLPPA